VHATPAVRDGLAFIAGCDMVFRAIHIATGQQAYAIDVGSYTAASPVIVGDRAYFGTYDSEVVALDLTARKVLWRFSDPDRQFPFYSSATFQQGRVILGGRDRMVRALDATTGTPAWSFAARARVDSSPVLAGGRIYVGSSDNRLYVLDAATGAKHWEFDAGGAITASPAIAAGRLVIGTQDGVIYCLG
jgi:outer membrane protein assembly factor BamB